MPSRCWGSTARALDLAQPGMIPAALAGHRFDVLIHPAALTSPDAAEDDPPLAARVNAEAPGVLAEECRRRGARMIHISTDYVFGGQQPGMRHEGDPAQPLGEYGRSKLAGEQAVMDALPAACVLRVCWLYGPGKPGFPEQVIGRARDGGRDRSGRRQVLAADIRARPGGLDPGAVSPAGGGRRGAWVPLGRAGKLV